MDDKAVHFVHEQVWYIKLHQTGIKGVVYSLDDRSNRESNYTDAITKLMLLAATT